mgnify:CR=1 FL=1
MLWRIRALPDELVTLVLSERERWFYWSPVLLALGIGGYFALAQEPPRLLGPIILLFCFGGALAVRHRMAALYLAMVPLLIVAGFTAAQIRTTLVQAPMLDKKIGPVLVQGVVSAREVREDGGRIVLEQVVLDTLPPEQTPEQIRLTLRQSLPLPAVGASIRVLANLLPPMEPAYPGAYNFRREAFYNGIGAYGMALTAPELTGADVPISRAERLREAMVEQVSARLPGAEGAIAVALMTGERGAIDDKTNADMRGAGTAHLLSISGMHIGMVGGFVFFLVRALLALVPGFALRLPIKGIAAVVGLLTIVAYTWFVGAPIPAQRAALMTAFVFIAILFDRQVMNLRTVALSACAILLVFPESLLNPGFQMSYAAIVLLVAAYEYWATRTGEDKSFTLSARAWRYVVGIIVTSVIAGLATMPYGAWHFHRVQLLGVLGNLIAVPLTGFIIMPAMVVAYPLLPLGLADGPLQLMYWGLQGVTQSAAWIAALPYASLVLGQFSTAALLVMTFGGLWLALWQTGLRWAGVGIILLGVALVPWLEQPVVLVHAEGRVAVRGSDGALYVQRTPGKGMVLEQWTLAYADNLPIKNWRDDGSLVRCDKLGCVYDGRIALPARAVASLDDCTRADIVIAPDLKLPGCAARVVIDKTFLRERGSSVIYADGRVESLRQPGRRRVWEPMIGTAITQAD